MASTTRAFLMGVGATLLIAGVALGGGLMFAKNMMDPTHSAPGRSAASQLPPARVVLPTLAEAAAQPTPAAPARREPVSAPAPTPAATVQPESAGQPTQVKEVQATPERDKAAERAERRKAEAEEREHRKRVADRKAKRDAARIARLQQRQHREEPSIMAFGGDNEQPRTNGGLFGN